MNPDPQIHRRCPCCEKPAETGLVMHGRRIARAALFCPGNCDYATDEQDRWRFYVGGINRVNRPITIPHTFWDECSTKPVSP